MNVINNDMMRCCIFSLMRNLSSVQQVHDKLVSSSADSEHKDLLESDATNKQPEK